jgi:hypothetical protein
MTPLQLNDENFKEPVVPEKIETTTVAVDFNTLFWYVVTCCGGEIKENEELLKSNTMYQEYKTQRVQAAFRYSDKKVNGLVEPDTKPRIFINKRKLALKENIIPIKSYVAKEVSKLSEAEKNALSNAITKQLTDSYNKAKEFELYNYIIKEHKDLVSKDAATGSYTLNFINDPTKLMSAGLVLYDWGTATFKNGKAEKIALSSKLMPVYDMSTSDTTNKVSYRLQCKQLHATNNTLSNLAQEYPAAKHLYELGVKTEDIIRVYDDYTAAKSAAKKSKATSSNGKVKATSSDITAEAFSATFLNKVASGQNLISGIDSNKIFKNVTKISTQR